MNRSERNSEILRLKQSGVRNKEIAQKFGIKPAYVGELCKELKRMEMRKHQPESLDKLPVFAYVMLSKHFGITCLADLQKFIESSSDWREQVLEKTKKPKAVELIESFARINGIRTQKE